jgi:tripartite-type tricarboxylate transporter receptor subunit TctC
MKKITVALAVLLLSSQPLPAQETARPYPSQPIHLVVPTGASGVIGSAYVARATPDVVSKGMPHAKTEILKLDCYHPAASAPEICAALAEKFLATLR